MANKNTNRYYVKNSISGSFTDVCQLFGGCNVLAIEGFDSKGRALNTYAEQWITNGSTDFAITSNDGVIVRENIDVKVVFVVGQRYTNSSIDTQVVYDNFVDYMTNTDIWVASKYVNKQVHCVANDAIAIKSAKLHRGGNSYILGEITLKTLEKPQTFIHNNAPYNYILLDKMNYAGSVDTYADVYHLVYDGNVQDTGVTPSIGEQDILIYECDDNDDNWYTLVRKSDLLDIVNNGRWGASIEILRGETEDFDNDLYDGIIETISPFRVLGSYETRPEQVHIYDLIG